jgi:hypothetical protein
VNNPTPTQTKQPKPTQQLGNEQANQKEELNLDEYFSETKEIY